ncbi:MAG: 3'-5' exonuclease [Microscillaceae bacterium]
MFSEEQLTRILFLDIETARGHHHFNDLSPALQALWSQKAEKIRNSKEDTPEMVYEEKAGIFAEFGKIICISFGFLTFSQGQPYFRFKSFFSEDEKEILLAFGELLDRKFKGWQLCAHNGKEFDFPYMGRRFLINQIALPEILQVQGKKPWEVSFLDTMELWKFGDYKNYTKLELLCALFEIPTPKDDIDGSQVGRVYWEEKDLPRIAHYCEKDVIATAQVLLKYCILPGLSDAHIQYAT